MFQPGRLSAFTLTILSCQAVLHASASRAADCNAVSALTLPPGFCASIFAEDIGHARHLAVAEDGTVYVNTWSGPYYGKGPVHPGGFLVALKDTLGSGKADIVERFGDTVDGGSAGGTGIAIYKGSLYAEANGKIVRYVLKRGSATPKGPPTTVVSGLPLDGDHPMHPFVIDRRGNLYVDLASATNSCQVKNRAAESAGADPCIELETRGGVWRFDARKSDQVFDSASRFATGMRNAEGFALNGEHIYVTVHGRDQLHTSWPKLYQVEDEATLPAETMVLLEKGADYGWPQCYFDPRRNKLVQAPEYGGDGGEKIGVCAAKTSPIAIYPAHWAPTDAVFYDRKAFPEHYRNGVFIAFHGSWNRAPYAQQGYNVVFQPMRGTQARAGCEIFAEGFAGAVKSPEKAVHRPTGLAIGTDGALFVADDTTGRIYKISYQGGNSGVSTLGTPVACPDATAPAGAVMVADTPPGPSGGTSQNQLIAPPGVSLDTVELGGRIYHGEIAGATCQGCHGGDGGGSPLGPSLIANRWTWSDGSVQGITATIVAGVPHPKAYRAAMPAMGGAQLTADQSAAVGAYVWAISHQSDAPADSKLPGGSSAARIEIAGESIFPESLTSTLDGTVIIGSIGQRAIYKAEPRSTTARLWIGSNVGPTLDARMGVFGVFADDKHDTLWACYSVPPGPKTADTPQALIRSFGLHTGAFKSDHVLPTASGFCNDIAVGSDGTVYATDSANMEVVALKPQADRLIVWAGNGAFGPSQGVLDGIAVLGHQVLVNTLMSGRVFGVTIQRDGQPGPVSEIRLKEPLDHPDGMRAYGKDALLVVEGGGPGRLTRLKISSDGGSSAEKLQEGFPDGAVAVTQVGDIAYVLEGQLARLMRPENAGPAKPFHATGISLSDR